jgi:uncharacterized protein YjiS (DUF1127 family)
MLWMVSEWPPFRWLRSACFWTARPRLLRLRMADAMALRRSYHELAQLDARLCEDVGVTAQEAGRQATRPLGDELSPWAPPELCAAVAESRRSVPRHRARQTRLAR